MKINKQGIVIETRYDDIIWLWWWNRTSYKMRFLSYLTQHRFSRWKDIIKVYKSYRHNKWDIL